MKKIITGILLFLLCSCVSQSDQEMDFKEKKIDITTTHTGITNEQRKVLEDYLIDLERVLREKGYDNNVISQAINEAREEELQKMLWNE